MKHGYFHSLIFEFLSFIHELLGFLKLSSCHSSLTPVGAFSSKEKNKKKSEKKKEKEIPFLSICVYKFCCRTFSFHLKLLLRSLLSPWDMNTCLTSIFHLKKRKKVDKQNKKSHPNVSCSTDSDFNFYTCSSFSCQWTQSCFPLLVRQKTSWFHSFQMQSSNSSLISCS